MRSPSGFVRPVTCMRLPFFAYLIVRERDGLVVGDAGFHGPPNEAGEVEIGYGLVPAARGEGLATEAVRLLTRWATAQEGVRAVIAQVDEANEFAERSEHLLRRLGFAFGGVSGGMRRCVLSAAPARATEL
jgi:RimJ/RimL family protein N-acetyltransferase